MNSPIATYRNHNLLHNYLNKRGKLIVWTKIHVAPQGFEHQTPYFVGIIQFEDGERLPLEVVDTAEEILKPNLKVQTVIRRIGKHSSDGVIQYGIKVKPI